MGFDERAFRRSARRCPIRPPHHLRARTRRRARARTRWRARASRRDSTRSRRAGVRPHPGWRGHLERTRREADHPEPADRRSSWSRYRRRPWARARCCVRNHFSVVSPGTEKLALDFARKSLLGKARSRPDLVRRCCASSGRRARCPTYRTVMNRLDAPQPLGYSSAGSSRRSAPASRASPPAIASRARAPATRTTPSSSRCPRTWSRACPTGSPLEQAAFATLGAIALQGLRVAAPTLGEIAAVIGLGLIGQLSVQLLRANGCRVLGIDLDAARVKQALDQGAEWGARPGDDFRGLERRRDRRPRRRLRARHRRLARAPRRSSSRRSCAG